MIVRHEVSLKDPKGGVHQRIDDNDRLVPVTLCSISRKCGRESDKTQDSGYIYYISKCVQERKPKNYHVIPFETLCQNKCSGYFYP